MQMPDRIYCYEHPDERTILRTQAAMVPKSLDVRALSQQMFSLMDRANGIGLAGPQVGLSYRLFVIHIPKHGPMVFINPEIISTTVELSIHEEGCLSLPGLYAHVTRPAAVKIQAYDISHKLFTLEAQDLLATCIQHEFDHLEGVLFTDHLGESDQKKLLAKYEKMAKRRHKRG